MKIAVLGTRGVPARYGGFETCAEELGRRFVRDGHEVDVFCRAGYYQEKTRHYLGMRLIYAPYLKSKSLETLSHTFFSLLGAAGRRYDVIFIFNPGNGLFLWLPKLRGQKTVLNIDGLEWERNKWTTFGRTFHKLSARLATRFADVLVADSREIQKYYSREFKKETAYISYGAEVESSRNHRLLKRHGLETGGYFLQVTRFEPENNPWLTIQAFRRLTTNKKLVLVGGVKYSSPYSQKIAAARDSRILFPGFVYDPPFLRELRANCFAYIHGNEVGGTNPALLQAMASGCFVIARDVAFNREVLQDAGIYFGKDVPDLAARMQWALNNADNLSAFQREARLIIASQYNWDDSARSYERIFRSLTGRS
jgi:glycosyltransferase involved in cell wall biosynthesis